MGVIRHELRIDVTAALPAEVRGEPVHLAATLVADPDRLGRQPTVIVGIPGGTYSRRYWDLQPPGLPGYSHAEWVAGRGGIFVACDYLGGGDSSRPADGDFMTLEVCADAAHELLTQLCDGLAKGTL